MTNAVVVSLIGLIVVIVIQIVFVSRWTGKIDGYMAANDERFRTYIATNDRRVSQNEAEIIRLRDARHVADGKIQRHEGWLKELDRRHNGRRITDLAGDSGD